MHQNVQPRREDSRANPPSGGPSARPPGSGRAPPVAPTATGPDMDTQAAAHAQALEKGDPAPAACPSMTSVTERRDHPRRASPSGPPMYKRSRQQSKERGRGPPEPARPAVANPACAGPAGASQSRPPLRVASGRAVPWIPGPPRQCPPRHGPAHVPLPGCMSGAMAVSRRRAVTGCARPSSERRRFCRRPAARD